MDAGVDFATSDVIDIDDILGDHKIDTCDMGTDPAFDDNQELLRSLEDKLRKSTSALETEKEKNVEMREKYEKCQDSRQQKWKENREMLEKKNDELEDLKRSLHCALEKKHQAERNHEFTMAENKKVVQELKKLIASLKEENSELRDENRELEERHWSLETMMRRQTFPKSIIMVTSPDCISNTSSGFLSAPGLDLPESNTECQGELQSLRSGLELQALEAEAERLTDLLSVMEDREEQLLGQVRAETEARTRAEDRVRSTEGVLARRKAAEEVGDKMKKVLLLTAAFGAVHSALQHDLVIPCTML